MKKWIVRALATLGVLTLLLVLLSTVPLFFKGSVPKETVLEIDFEQALPEAEGGSALSQLLNPRAPTLRDVVDAIDGAAKDARVKGLVAHIRAGPGGMAQVQELRDAIKRFRASKKFAIAFSESFGEAGPGNTGYYLASAFDSIYLQPSGDVALTGLMMQGVFIKDALQKIGVHYRGDHRREYKSALDFFTEENFTAANKEATTALMDAWFSQLQAGICEERKITPEAFQKAVDGAPLLGNEALAAHLVDGLMYRDEVYELIKKRVGPEAEWLYLERYLERAGRAHETGPKVALIFGVGGVMRGESDYDALRGDLVMGSDTVAAALRAAASDDDVKAIVFRIDSPGGSYVASDTIWREVVNAQKKKPVIATMGNVAGSGGYYVAMAAHKIVAQPGTITGSIGVLSGKPVLAGLFDKLGVRFDEVHRGQNATFYTLTKDYSESEWKRLEAWLDRAYEDFTEKVAKARNMPLETVQKIAKGRIWSGQDAKENGLIDALGGYETAIKLAKEAAKLSDRSDVNVVVYPKIESWWSQLWSRGADSSDEEGLRDAFIGLFHTLQPVVRMLDTLGLTVDRGLRASL